MEANVSLTFFYLELRIDYLSDLEYRARAKVNIDLLYKNTFFYKINQQFLTRAN